MLIHVYLTKVRGIIVIANLERFIIILIYVYITIGLISQRISL